MWGGCSLRERRNSDPATPEAQSPWRSRNARPRPRGHCGVPLLEFPFLGFAGTAAAVTSASRAGTVLPATSLPVPCGGEWGREEAGKGVGGQAGAPALPWQVWVLGQVGNWGADDAGGRRGRGGGGKTRRLRKGVHRRNEKG